MRAVVRPERTDAVACPGCDRLLAFNTNSAGQVVICPSCQRRVQMPTAAELQYESSSKVFADSSRPGGYAPSPPEPIGSRETAITREATRETFRPFIDDQDPYASPPLTRQPNTFRRTPTDYATPGWFLVGSSVLALGYDVLWLFFFALSFIGNNAGGALGIVAFLGWGLLSIASHILGLLAGVCMIRRTHLSLVRAGAILALIPCGSCYLLQVPFAVWAVVVAFGTTANQDFEP
jgi:hypothetical protein